MNTTENTYNSDDELSVRDLINFLATYWISIITAGATGLTLALAYVFVAPPVFESKLQIEMARAHQSVPRLRADTGQSGEMRGVPVEEAALLVERLRLPSTYTESVSRVCAGGEPPVPLEKLVRRVTARPVKTVNTVVEITVQGASPEGSKACAEAVFEMVRVQQNQLLLPILQDARQDIQSMQKRLAANQEFLATLEKTGIQSAVYLAKRDESIWLMEQIALLERLLSRTVETRLVSPIYTAQEQVSPRLPVALIAGLFGGLMLGLLWAFLRKNLSSGNTLAH